MACTNSNSVPRGAHLEIRHARLSAAAPPAQPASVWSRAITGGLTLIALLMAGCLREQHPGQPNPLAMRLRPKPVIPGLNAVLMDVVFLERPMADATLNRSLWVAADEEQLDIAQRRALAQRGFRIGVFDGPIAATLGALFNDEELAEPNGQHLMLPSGSPTELQTSGIYAIWPGEAGDSASSKQPLSSAAGSFRLTPTITPDGCVELAMTPEIQHGESTRQFVPNDEQRGRMDWTIHFARQARAFDELAFSLRLHADQCLMLSCQPGQPDSLGTRFFTRTKDGRTLQRVVLIQAEPSPAAKAAPPSFHR